MATTDVNVHLKAKNKKGEVAYRLLPKTLANNVTTTTDMQFVSEAEKKKWNNKLDSIESITDADIKELFK